MITTSLRKVGGSVMLAVPPAILDLVQLRSGATVNITVENGRLVVEPSTRKRYSLHELLAECDLSAPLPDSVTDEDAAWIASAPEGRELI
jgi:antitoxin ChpS